MMGGITRFEALGVLEKEGYTAHMHRIGRVEDIG